MDKMFPTEVIRLPSYGKFYPEEHPLRKNGGRLEIKYMTAKEEDILTNTNLLRNGKTLDKLIESLVVHDGVDYQDLSANDITAILLFSRVISYGKDYEIELLCNHCNKQTTSVVDLTSLEAPDEGDVIEPNPDGTLTFNVPSGKSITIRVLTRKDEIEIDRQLEIADSKGLSMNIISSRLKRIVTSIDDITDKTTISSMVENLIVADTREIRSQYNRITPMVDIYVEVSCSHCGQMTGGQLPVSANFFWPDL